MLEICHLPQVIKNRHFESHTTLHFEPLEGGIFAASDSCFGYGVKKLHKAIQDKLRDLDYQIVPRQRPTPTTPTSFGFYNLAGQGSKEASRTRDP